MKSLIDLLVVFTAFGCSKLQREIKFSKEMSSLYELLLPFHSICSQLNIAPIVLFHKLSFGFLS